MSSILPGFEYDIFISYRQKDNKYDGWVTEFVANLRKELEATFKEDVTIYFDANPHDGLLETHNVDKSLEGKLRCLIFIPIISQTYCDPKSFAWEHELCAFNKMARQDSLGREVKLGNGNVASRILPVKIHDLETEDKSLVEAELGGVLRPIEFIYKSSGVNRPLRANEDHPQDNLNKVYYRDQINKVANSVKEIIGALKKPIDTRSAAGAGQNHQQVSAPAGFSRKWMAIAAAVIILFAIGAYFFFLPNLSLLKDPGSSGVAVLPFRNFTGSEDLNYYGVGMASEIRTKLSMSKQFSFISSLQATLPYSDTKKTPKEIGGELGVDYLLSGLYQKDGEKLKVEVELIDASTGRAVWSLPFESELKDIFQVQASIAGKVLNQFSREVDLKENENAPTKNLDAYANYLRGIESFENPDARDWSFARIFQPGITQFEKAVQLDSGYMDAWAALINSESYVYLNEPDSLRKIRIEKYVNYVNAHFPDSWVKKFAQGEYAYRVAHDFDQGLDLLLQVLKADPNNVIAMSSISGIYRRKLDYGKAIQYAVKAVNLDPGHSQRWANIGDILRGMGDNANWVKVMLKSWELSHSKRDARRSLFAAMDANYDMDQLPEALKKELGPEFIRGKAFYARDWNIYKRLALSTMDTAAVSMAYWFLGKKDSARLWAKRGLKRVEDPTFNFAIFHAVIGDREKAFSALATYWQPYGEKKGDIEETCQKTSDYIWLHSIFGEYKVATEKLIRMNNDYPEYGA